MPIGGHICGPCRHMYKRRKLAKDEKLKSYGANPEVQERKKPDEKPFTCKICKKGLKSKRNLKVHNETMHEGNKSYIHVQDIVSTARVRKTPA